MTDIATRNFREGLMRRGEEARARALKGGHRNKASLSDVFELLETILALIKKDKSGDPGPVEFVVTERDSAGKIKSFRVE